jgi:hypothetical protein
MSRALRSTDRLDGNLSRSLCYVQRIRIDSGLAMLANSFGLGKTRKKIRSMLMLMSSQNSIQPVIFFLKCKRRLDISGMYSFAI